MGFISKQSLRDIIHSDEYFNVPALGKALYFAMLCSCTVGGFVKDARILGAITDIPSDTVFDIQIASLIHAGLIRSCDDGFYICNWPKICDPEFIDD